MIFSSQVHNDRQIYDAARGHHADRELLYIMPCLPTLGPHPFIQLDSYHFGRTLIAHFILRLELIISISLFEPS